jgi:putative acetyltransferase
MLQAALAGLFKTLATGVVREADHIEGASSRDKRHPRCVSAGLFIDFPPIPEYPGFVSSEVVEESPNVIVRAESPADIGGVRAVNLAAFKDDGAAKLVDSLRANGKLVLSLVAEKDGVIGHIAFSSIQVEPALEEARILGLGPLAVRPAEQGAGVGSRLVREGLEAAKSLGYTHVVLLGGKYYHRFGFVPTPPYRIRSAYNAGDHFMILPLCEMAAPVDVMMTYEPEFAEAGC